MKRYEKFKVGQKVRVVEKVQRWRFNGGGGADWAYQMDKTIGKVFEIIEIDKYIGYRLETRDFNNYDFNYWYSVESLQKSVLVGEQLLFSFMSEAT